MSFQKECDESWSVYADLFTWPSKNYRIALTFKISLFLDRPTWITIDRSIEPFTVSFPRFLAISWRIDPSPGAIRRIDRRQICFPFPISRFRHSPWRPRRDNRCRSRCPPKRRSRTLGCTRCSRRDSALLRVGGRNRYSQPAWSRCWIR